MRALYRKPRSVARTFTEIDLAGGETTVGQLCDEYLAHLQDPRNPERPRDQLNPPQRIAMVRAAFGPRPAASVRPFEVSDWLRSLNRKPATLNRYKSTFSAIYRYARGRERITVNPVRDVPQFRVALPPPRFMDHDEEAKLRRVIQGWIDSCPAHHQLTRLHLHSHLHEITLAVGTGMRKGNQYGLRWEDVDLRHRLIHIPLTKAGTHHTVPVTDDVFAALLDQQRIQSEIARLHQESGDDPLHKTRMTSDGRIFSIRKNREWFAKACKQAGVKKLRWHDLGRHTTGSRLAQSGANLKVIQEVLGHATIAMSARYSHLNKAHLAESMAVLNRRDT